MLLLLLDRVSSEQLLKHSLFLLSFLLYFIMVFVQTAADLRWEMCCRIKLVSSCLDDGGVNLRPLCTVLGGF